LEGDPEPFTGKIAQPDMPGEFCFPPLASLITGGARLMLGLLKQVQPSTQEKW
jgi:hypothetical protein